MLLGTFGASLSGNFQQVGNKQSKRRNNQSWLWILNQKIIILPHPQTNFEIEKYYQNKPRFDSFYSRDNIPDTIKDEAYVINLDEYSDTGSPWIALYVLNNNVTYFNGFGVEQITKEIKKSIDRSTIKTIIYRTKSYDSVVCGYFSMGFIDFMYNGKSLTGFTNLFSPNNFKKKMMIF